MGILRLCVTLTLFLLINCENISSGNGTSSTVLEKGVYNTEPPQKSIVEDEDDTATLAPTAEQPEEEKNELPILPPIILLDFADDNSTSSEEKYKRTINNNLGYGYLQNNLLNGKFNYYFPGGKTGTTVSIEESISPFEPKTIIEHVKPITEKSISNIPAPIRQTNRRQQPNSLHPNYVGNYQLFGQRTKLQKYSPPDPYSQSISSTPKPNGFTTVTPNHRNIQSAYPTLIPGPQNVYNNYDTSQPSQEWQTSTSVPPTYESRYNSFQPQRQRPSYHTDTSRKPLATDPAAFNLPKYTVENGIRYENKIVWKYPDGRVIDTPPTSYMNSYSEYAEPSHQNMASNAISYQQTHQHLGSSPEALATRITNSNRYSQQMPKGAYQTSEIESNSPEIRDPPTRILNNNIYNQRPAQFPTDQDSRYQSVNLNNYNSGASSQSQSYDFSYQQKYGLRQRNPEPVAAYDSMSKYAVDSSNPEPTPSSISESSFTPDGQLTTKTLSKYSPEAQKYLKKIFNQSNHQTTHQPQNRLELNQYTNTNYENLLNYNPSISEYIKDPSSILNAQPTFIQAGNSLIPVIILRVGGTPPTQRTHAPTLNLKALLQQYLSQYAESKAALSVPSTYRYEESISKTPTPIHQSTVNDLTKLTHVLSRFSQSQKAKHPSLTTLAQKLADHPLDNNPNPLYYGKSSYDTIEQAVDQRRDQLKIEYGSRIGAKQKVKNVQIISTS